MCLPRTQDDYHQSREQALEVQGTCPGDTRAQPPNSSLQIVCYWAHWFITQASASSSMKWGFYTLPLQGLF